jgi:hypothetical protein
MFLNYESVRVDGSYSSGNPVKVNLQVEMSTYIKYKL